MKIESNPFIQIGEIFNPLNEKYCSNCQEAIVSTIKDARNKNVFCSKEAGCCSYCAVEGGYFIEDIYFLSGLNTSRSERKKIKQKLNDKSNELKTIYGFNKKYGFFDAENHSCRLPREERSLMCSKHYCNALESRMYEIEKEEVNALFQKMANIRARELGIIP